MVVATTAQEGYKPMAILSDVKIQSFLQTGELIIHPILDESQIKGTKVDLRLDNVIYLIRRIQVDSYDALEVRRRANSAQPNIDYLEKFVIPYGNGFVIHPGEFALAGSFEFVKMPKNLVGLLDGRSSLGRLGIIVHVTSGAVDPGFGGPVTLELANLGRIPVKLYPLMRIASVKFVSIEGEVKHPYAEKYKGIENILNPYSRLHEDEDLGTIGDLAKFV